MKAARSSPGVTRPDFHQLEIFLKVVEARSFAEAGRMLGRSQPAISQAIARLEDIYGGDLFERRRGASLKLTPIGEAILPSARTIIVTIDQQMMGAAAIAQSQEGNITIGFHTGLAAGPLRSAIAGFVAASPQVHLRMVEAPPGELHRQLNERSIDLVLAAMLPQLSSKILVQERLWNERLVIALAANDAFVQKSALSWQDIAGLPIILKDSHVELVAYRALLERNNRQVHLAQHDVSTTTLFDMVGLGLGATIILVSAAVPHRDVVFRPINEDNAFVGIDAIWPQDDRNPLRHRLLSLIREHKSDLVA